MNISKKAALFSVLLITLTVASAILYVNNKNDKSQLPIGDRGPTAEEIRKEAVVNSDAKRDLVESPDNTDMETDGSLDVTATQESNGSVTIVSRLSGYNTGTCKLNIMANGTTYDSQAAIIYQPEFSTCAGFNILKSELGSGNWTIKLSVLSNGDVVEKVIEYTVL